MEFIRFIINHNGMACITTPLINETIKDFAGAF